ncbi:MAG: hypothetical protein HYZ26_07585 [Chloroflexi bacterium]|nr:hypothetical protein [Chloroflexota bacterium]
MKIEVLYSPQCIGYLPALKLVQEVLAETDITAQVELVRVETEAEAQRLQFIGSPTVRVDGLDVEPYVTFGRNDFGLRCRVYREGGQELDWPSHRIVKDTIEVGHLAEMGMLGRCC